MFSLALYIFRWLKYRKKSYPIIPCCFSNTLYYNSYLNVRLVDVNSMQSGPWGKRWIIWVVLEKTQTHAGRLKVSLWLYTDVEKDLGKGSKTWAYTSGCSVCQVSSVFSSKPVKQQCKFAGPSQETSSSKGIFSS